MKTETKEYERAPIACERCGFLDSYDRMDKRRSRGASLLCRSCDAKPQKMVRYGRDNWCIPWQGELDDDMNPVDSSGNLVRPGERTCGRKDCMRHAPEQVKEIDYGRRLPVGDRIKYALLEVKGKI